MIPHSKPFLDEQEVSAVTRVIKSGQIAQGLEVAALEKELADFLGVKGAVAVSSCTAALHLTLLTLGANASATVHMPSYVCSALLNAINYSGAQASICDVDPENGNLSAKDLRRKIKDKSDLVILPHMFGSPAPVENFLKMGLPIIEDCAQSIGAKSSNQMVGTFGLASVFSFYATKMICSGEGGAVASNSEDILQEIRDIRDYDKKSQYRLRYNYKMTEMQAAMARVQLRKLPAFIARRRQIASVYDQVLEPLPFKIFKRAEGDIYYRYFVACDNIQLALERFRAEGVWVSRPVSIAIHQLLGLSGYPGTEKIYKHALSIPCYPALLDIEMEYICKVIKKVASSL